jgi:hypothetical protein
VFDPTTLLLAGPALACYAADAVPTWQNPSKTCSVFHSITGGLDTFMFRGTETWQEWFQDFDPSTEVDADDPDIGWVHAPSLDNVREVLPLICTWLAAKGWPQFYLAGHSKGAREVVVAHALLKHIGHPSLATRGYETPRPGGSKLADYVANDNISGTQTHNSSGFDVVTLAPAGFGWEPAFRNILVQVPDNLSFVQKHIMSGVVLGLGLVV